MFPESRFFLVGPMGAGKTTIGRKLAELLHFNFVDMDLLLEERTGVTVSHIFEIEGEQGFRDRESKLLQELLTQDRLVVSTGGGVINSPENRRMLIKGGTVIYLSANIRILWKRLRNCQTRPLLQQANPRAVLANLLEQRQPLYTEVADITYEISSDSALKAARILHDKIIQSE